MTDLERAVCRRLKAARERIGITQQKCAEEIEVTRASLATYETGRSPVRLDVGLRFCRRFIVSEEWLATGGYASAIAAAPAHGQIWEGMPEGLEDFFFRQCLDLSHEPEARNVRQNLAFGRAFTEFLQPAFSRLMRGFFYFPRIVFTDDDPAELIADFIREMFLRRLRLLRNEAVGIEVSPAAAGREFGRVCFETIEVLWKRMKGIPTPELVESRFDFLRALMHGPDMPFGIVAMKKAGVAQNAVARGVGNAYLSAVNLETSHWEALRERLHAVTSERGAKAGLSKAFGVKTQSVSQWLSGDSIPSAENALRLVDWVAAAEAQNQKDSGRAETRPEQATQPSKSSNEKAKPGRKRP